MADLNKFQRSRDRITEILNYLMVNPNDQDKASLFIETLQKSAQIIDDKIEKLKSGDMITN
jgi:hypothetical protein